MPPDFPTWLFYAVAGAAVIWLMPRLLTFALEAFADAVVDKLEDRLAPRWSADIDDRLEAIEVQLKPNGGESLHDRIIRMERAIHTLNMNTAKYDPPEGHPA